MQAREVHRSKRLKEQLELQDLEAQHMLEVPMVGAQPVGELLSNDDDPSVAQVLGKGTDLASDRDHDEAHLHMHIQQGYLQDKMFTEILNRPREHSQFTIEQKLIYTVNALGAKVLCIPRDRLLITTILEQAHTIVGHFGYQKMLDYVHRTYWWLQMAKEI
ncbi:hypothetical protein C0995_013416, partial [Termitomyces sp. Mi166